MAVMYLAALVRAHRQASRSMVSKCPEAFVSDRICRKGDIGPRQFSGLHY